MTSPKKWTLKSEHRSFRAVLNVKLLKSRTVEAEPDDYKPGYVDRDFEAMLTVFWQQHSSGEPATLTLWQPHFPAQGYIERWLLEGIDRKALRRMMENGVGGPPGSASESIDRILLGLVDALRKEIAA